MYYETLGEEIAYRRINKEQRKQTTAEFTLIRFEAEINAMYELSSVIRSFIRYSTQRIDTERLATIAVKRIEELAGL